MSMDVGSRGSCSGRCAQAIANQCSTGAGGSFREERAVLQDKPYLKQRSLEEAKLCFKQFCIAVKKRCSCTAGSLCMLCIYTLAFISAYKHSICVFQKTHRHRCICTQNSALIHLCLLSGLYTGQSSLCFCFLTFQGEKCPAVASEK